MREALNAGAQATLESGDEGADGFLISTSRRSVVSPPLSEPTVSVNGLAYVPPVLPQLPPGVTTAPEPIDMDRMRQRGQVSGFIRSGGVDWTGQGPNPLNPGCKVRPDVMAEFRDTLRALQGQMDDINAEKAAMRAAGVPV